jgi:hypothetical protein
MTETATKSFAGLLSPGRFAFLLGLLIFAAFPKVILGIEAFFFRDYGVLGYPFVFYHRECFWRGEIPLWNPLSNCGAPFLAQWGTMVLYPFSLIYLLLPLPWSLGFFCLLHLFLGGMGMYYLARRWTGNNFGAAFAGIAFVFNGTVFSCLLWPNYMVALGWMPWLVLATERAAREGPRAVAIAALIGAMQMLSGVPELIVFTWIIVGVVWLTGVIQRQQPWGSLLRLAAVVLLVAGLTACQLLPFFDLLASSHRTANTGGVKWAMPGWGWANLFVPFFHTYENNLGVIFQHEQAFMTSYYPGIIALVLGAWAAWKVRTVKVLALVLLVLLGYILALGPHGAVYGWIKSVVPALGFARFPVKFVLLAAFILPVLAAFGIARLQTDPRSAKCRVLYLFAIIAASLTGALLWFAWKYPFPFQDWTELWQNTGLRLAFLALTLVACVLACRHETRRVSVAAALVCLVLVAFDAMTHTHRQNPTIASSGFVPGMWQAKHGTAARPLRVAITPDAEHTLLRTTLPSGTRDFLTKRLALWSNLNLLDGIAKVNGSSTLQLREQKHIEQLLYPTNRNDVIRWSVGLLDFLGVTHLTGTNVTDWTQRSGALPIITCGQRPIFASDAKALDAVTRGDFEPRSVVYLPESVHGQCQATGAGQARVGALKASGNKASCLVQCDEPTLVVVAQSYHRNWSAAVDGTSTPLWRANYAFQALQVPAGTHEIVLKYEDNRFVAGSVVSLAALGICLGLCRVKTKREAVVQESI